MPLGNPIPGGNWAVEYMVSAIPWLTSSTISPGITRFDFQSVTRFFVVKNTSTLGQIINVGVTYNGVAGSNYFAISPSESFEGEIRCTALYVSASVQSNVSIIAGLTTIPVKQVAALTGSSGMQGVG